jgi:DNA-binding GntR family transcriptional regulator
MKSPDETAIIRCFCLEYQMNSETAGEKAYWQIRRDILFGRLEPSQKLRLDDLRENYGISISTLREVLNRLTAEGLIVAEGARGFEVAPVSPENLKELAHLRLLLECHALQQSFTLGDMDWEGRVVAAHHKLATMENRILTGDRSALEILKRYDWEFHHALLSACGSRVMLDAHAGVFDKYHRYLMIALIFRGEISSREHRQLLESALKRDFQTAKKVLTQHVNDCVSYTLTKWPIDQHPAERKKTASRVAASA